MKSYYKMIKRWDIIVVFSLVLLSFIPFFIFTYIQSDRETATSVNVAVISVDGKEVKRITLSDNQKTHIFDIHDGDGGVNTIEVKDNKIRIKSANCSDQVCVLTGFIKKPGETIVCLPHKVLIEIVSENQTSDEMIISS
ncbi:NusG domain II-containing protein [Bacillus andreraoultii]|uniref:NusG domain II-containing protein n=1 Tax=Bacillus andreraoultii TaxID=1499685 RepID=UPI0005397799|nr:NusG domain II-containing protein [Bacillus andreraoultii]